MGQSRNLNREQLEGLVQKAKETRAPASIRALGSPRLLGDLEVCGLESGISIHLMGAKRRDQIPPPGTEVTLSVLVEDEVITAHTTLMEAIISTEGDTLFPPILRVAWLERAIEFHRRGDVRVATPDLPPLKASLAFDGRILEARLLNLTETGMGLGIGEQISMLPHARTEVEVILPGGTALRVIGEVRHAELLDNDILPTRIGLVFAEISDHARESLHRFVQARRTDRVQVMRKSF